MAGMGNGGFRHASEKKTGCIVAELNRGPEETGTVLGSTGVLEGGIASICVLGASGTGIA